MGDKRDAESFAESEFGIGEGLIDPVARADRSLPVEQQLWEIAALPNTFDGSEVGLPGGKRLPPEETPVPRLLPGDNRE